MENDIVKRIEKKTGIDMRSVSKVADAFKENNRYDEYKVRRAVKHAGFLFGKRFPKEWENAVVSKVMGKNRNRR
ncbi:stage VI sporulation protein F [Aquibacillus kalidii]|uniref:stage VI sporulation protein F n=1 Tax=Aquibacillus kalidii TaxID=2762597 RepID=UPI0016496749|nr:stage VI sporulation protein F [Aquibacillus kalidii]